MRSRRNAGGLPPGDLGWTGARETLSFVRDPFRFVEERLAAYGPVFKTRIAGTNVVVMTGPDAFASWLDESCVVRRDAVPPHVARIFAGPSLPMLDGRTHRRRKEQVLSAFMGEAIESYLPGLTATIDEALERWGASSSVPLTESLQVLALAGIAKAMVGLEEGEELDQLVDDYRQVVAGLAGLPVAVPGSTLHRSLRARDRVLRRLEAYVDRPGGDPRRDGVSRILAHVGDGGAGISRADAVLELHHAFLAGFVIFAELTALMLHLAEAPDLRRRLEAEAATLDANRPPTASELDTLEHLGRVVLEIKRITPVLPVLFGKARRTFEHRGHWIPQGWGVYLALTAHHRLPELYGSPERFDPDRFGEARAEHCRHAHAYGPQGPGPLTGHACPGTDFTTYFMALFAVRLLSGWTWEPLRPTWEYDYASVPPVPKGGLRVAVRPR